MIFSYREKERCYPLTESIRWEVSRRWPGPSHLISQETDSGDTLEIVCIIPTMQTSTVQLLAELRGHLNRVRGRTMNDLAFEEVSECDNRDASILTKAKHGSVAGHNDVCFSRYGAF